MTALDPGAAADRAHEIQLDHQLGVTTFPDPGPKWHCPKPECPMVRTTACKPAGCANDLINPRTFKAQYYGHTIDDDYDFADGWDE